MKLENRHKYRVWHYPTKTMYQVFSFCEDWVKVKIDDITVKYPMSDCEFMQCVGHIDKNGTLLYEGDIVKYSLASEDVVRKIYWAICGYWTIGQGVVISSSYACKQTQIGNIYQNPELLEGKNETRK